MCSCGNPEPFIVRQLELRNGDTQSCGCKRRDHFDKNIYEFNLEDEYGLYGVGYCTNTGSPFYFDMEDYPLIKDYTWYETISGSYHSMEAWDKEKNTQIKMYWIILGKYYDHADRNPLNNRKYNLRSATNVENSTNKRLTSRNKSGFVGVHYDNERNAWVAFVSINKKCVKIGRFRDKEDAIRARLEAEAKYYGEFAPQRHLFEEYGIEIESEVGDIESAI